MSLKPSVHKTQRDLWPALLLLLGTVIAIALGVAVPKNDARQVAVVFAPGSVPHEIATAISLSGALLVRAGGFDNIVILQLNADSHYTDLYRHGAWLVLDPVAGGGCDNNLTKETRVTFPTFRSEYNEQTS